MIGSLTRFRSVLLALDRQPIRADIDMQPFGLVPVLIELIAQNATTITNAPTIR